LGSMKYCDAVGAGAGNIPVDSANMADIGILDVRPCQK
jgi:hypothetical protein